jgi:hypothetical protein
MAPEPFCDLTGAIPEMSRYSTDPDPQALQQGFSAQRLATTASFGLCNGR